MATKTKTSKEPVATKAAVPADAAREAHDHMKSEPERHAGNQPLTLKQQRFVEEMLVDLNATAAYRRAGYAARGNAAESMPPDCSEMLRLPGPWPRPCVSARRAPRSPRTWW